MWEPPDDKEYSLKISSHGEARAVSTKHTPAVVFPRCEVESDPGEPLCNISQRPTLNILAGVASAFSNIGQTSTDAESARELPAHFTNIYDRQSLDKSQEELPVHCCLPYQLLMNWFLFTGVCKSVRSLWQAKTTER